MTKLRLCAQSWLALVYLLGYLTLPIGGMTINRFLGENEELVPGETYQYLPSIHPERVVMYDPMSGHVRSVWRYPAPPMSVIEQDSLPTVKRAQFLRIGKPVGGLVQPPDGEGFIHSPGGIGVIPHKALIIYGCPRIATVYLEMSFSSQFSRSKDLVVFSATSDVLDNRLTCCLTGRKLECVNLIGYGGSSLLSTPLPPLPPTYGIGMRDV
ncbi:hypothetical protein TcWFU_009357 [Taenia crassiceps]|uniref:Uncharacterized protein n=1 Tax=Taenia crassiceps TaxID=6207 RepID=A0ABR4QNG1_9CEST